MAQVIKDQFGRECFLQAPGQLLRLDLTDLSWGRELAHPPPPIPLPPLPPMADHTAGHTSDHTSGHTFGYTSGHMGTAFVPDLTALGAVDSAAGLDALAGERRPSLYGRPVLSHNPSRASLSARPSFTLGMALPSVDVVSSGAAKEAGPIFHEARVSFELAKKQSKVLDKAELKRVEIDEHLMSLEDVLQRFDVKVNTKEPIKSAGLDEEEIPDRIRKYGENILTPPKRKTAFRMFLEEFENFFAVLLILAGVLTFVTYGLDSSNDENIILGSVLFFITILNATIGFVQKFKSAKLMEELQNLLPQSCMVIRHGTLGLCPAANLVPGDVVKLKEGDKIPADVLIFHAAEMKVDNSSLTGEAEPQERSNKPGSENPLEAANLAFYGTLVTNGECFGIVIRTGNATVLGQIATLAGGDNDRESPLTKEIASLVIRIGVLAIVLGLTFFLTGIGMGYPIVQNFVFAIGIIVANVPQGLPATVTMTLTITARKLAYENVLVKNLLAIETLGSVSLLASDKTGTLTMNKMTVVNVWSSMEYISATDFNLDYPGAREMIDICFMCSRAKFEDTPENYELPVEERRVIGDATETALLKFSIQRVSQIPENKWHMSIHYKPHSSGLHTLYMKGAPERVLGKCSHIFIKGQIVPMTANHKAEFEKAYEKFASSGQRVLAFAMSNLPGDVYGSEYQFTKDPPTFPQDGFVFMGIFGIIDPPKPGVPEAVATCTSAGIQVMMITGDHPLTAEAIAREVGIIRGKTRQDVARERGVPESQIQEGEYDAVVIHGDKIDALMDRQWYNILRLKQIVFARTSPKHKLEIVLRCQAVGHIVAMTGDGVNDSPALKRADLGISMGISGSDVSKEAAAMILLDDNFPSVVQGIKQGRTVFENLKKSICYVLSHLLPEIIPFIFYIALGIPLGMSPLLVLSIDLGTEILPSIMFAFEPGESDIMELPPRKVGLVYVPEDGDDVIQSLTAQEAANKEGKKEGQDGKNSESLLGTIFGCFRSKKESDEARPISGRVETLVDKNLLLWAYINVGIIESTACMFQYFALYWSYGIYPGDLLGINQDHFTGDSDDDDFIAGGRVFTGAEQKRINREGQAVTFLCILMMQLTNMYICKSRRITFKPYMLWNNRWTTYALFYVASLAMFFIYTPGVQDIVGSADINGIPYLWPLPFMAFLFFYDYGRKVLIRVLHPKYGRHLYW